MLQAFGLSIDAESVYREMIRNPGLRMYDLARLMNMPVPRLREILDELERLSLVRRSSENHREWRLVSPPIGLKSLLAMHEAPLRYREWELAEARTAIAGLLREYEERQENALGRLWYERLENLDAAAFRLEELIDDRDVEWLALMPGSQPVPWGLTAGRSLDEAAIETGVGMRLLYLDSIINHPAPMKHIRHMIDKGAEVRTAPTLPAYVIIVDPKAALVMDDPDNPEAGAMLVRGQGLVAALRALFDQIWSAATPLGSRSRPNGLGLDAQEQEIVRLLAHGDTDEAVARKIGVSVRTARRMTADLMRRLDAKSRFQAGVRAAELGWTA